MSSENHKTPENNPIHMRWGIKLPKDFYLEGDLNYPKIEANIDTLISKGITSIEVPHNLAKGSLDERQVTFFRKLTAEHPEFHLTIHENIDNLYPFDYDEFQKTEGGQIIFDPHLVSQMARDMDKHDIAYAVESGEDAIKKAQLIGASVITIHPIGAIHGYAPPQFLEYDKMYFRGLANYLDLANANQSSPVRVGIENFVIPFYQPELNSNPDHFIRGSQSTDFATPNHLDHQIHLVQDINSPYVGFSLDFGHAYWSEDAHMARIMEVLDKLMDDQKLFHVHIHDTTKNADRHLAPGKGEIPFHPIMQELVKRNYQGILEVEVNNLEDSSQGKEYLEGLI